MHVRKNVPVFDNALLPCVISHGFLQHGVVGHAAILVEIQGIEQAVVKTAYHRTCLTPYNVHHQIPESIQQRTGVTYQHPASC